MIEHNRTEKLAKFSKPTVFGNKEESDLKMSYDSRDPYAVTFTFSNSYFPKDELDHEVEWVFGRELLSNGVEAQKGEIVGEGDVRMHTIDNDLGISHLELRSPYGRAILEVSKRDLSEFLDKTQEVVPMKKESEWYDIDEEIKIIRPSENNPPQ